MHASNMIQASSKLFYMYFLHTFNLIFLFNILSKLNYSG